MVRIPFLFGLYGIFLRSRNLFWFGTFFSSINLLPFSFVPFCSFVPFLMRRIVLYSQNNFAEEKFAVLPYFRKLQATQSSAHRQVRLKFISNFFFYSTISLNIVYITAPYQHSIVHSVGVRYVLLICVTSNVLK